MAIRDLAATLSERAQGAGKSSTNPPLRVLEAGVGYACRYAGWVLRRQGAIVTRVRLPSADETQPWLDSGKDVVDAEDLAGQLRDVDLCLTDRPEALGPLTSTAFPRPDGLARVVVVELGHPAADPDANASIAAASGVAAAIGEAGGPPLAPPGRMLEGLVGLQSACAALAAVAGARRDAVGEHVVVDPVRCIAGIVGVNAMQWVNYGLRLYRSGRSAYDSGGPYPFRIFRASDGWVVAICRAREEWDALLAMLGNPDWGSDPRFGDQVVIAKQYADEVTARIEAILSQWTVAEAAQRAKEFRVPLAPLRSVEDVLADGRLVSRGAGGRVELISPIDELPNPNPSTGDGGFRPAARVRRQNPAPPLAGLRVLDLGWVWAAPIAAAWLGDLGADVVKVESMDRLDVLRRRGIDFPVSGPGGTVLLPPHERALVFGAANRNKRSVSLNLKDPAEMARFFELVARAHVLIESFAGGVLERMGLATERLFRANPHLIVVSLGGATIDGSYVSRSYAPILTALAGVEHAVKDSKGEPLGMMNFGGADPNGGTWALFSVLSALVRGRSGVHLKASQLRGLVNTCAALYFDGAGAVPVADGEAEEITGRHIDGLADGPLGDVFREVTVRSWDPTTGERVGFANPWQFKRMQVGVRRGAPLLGNVDFETLFDEWS